MVGGRRLRSGPLLLGLLLAALVAVEVLPGSQLFVGAPLLELSGRPAAPTARRAEAETAVEEDVEAEEEEQFEWVHEIANRGIDLDGDKLDNLNEWYEETISGNGGKPSGFIRDLILRSFYGPFNDKNYPVLVRWDYTGPNGRPCATDYDTAYENMKREMKEGTHFMENDGQGWIWLVAGQNPGGLYLYLTKAPPYGERPLALIKEDSVDEFFEKVNWHWLFVRLHKWNLWGGKVAKFPYPIKGKKDYR